MSAAAQRHPKARGERLLAIDLVRDPSAPAAARAALERITDAFPAERYADARLLLTELVTNAVRHGEGGFVHVEVTKEADAARVEVIDEGGGFQAPGAGVDARDRLEGEGGRGLLLVRAIADAWGTFEGSTHVWFTLA